MLSLGFPSGPRDLHHHASPALAYDQQRREGDPEARPGAPCEKSQYRINVACIYFFVAVAVPHLWTPSYYAFDIA